MDTQVKKIIISETESGSRLDIILSKYFSSRSKTEKFIKNSGVKKENHIILKPAHIVKAGECYKVTLPPKSPGTNKPLIKPYKKEIPILYEDEHLLVINKPAGIASHPGPGNEQNSLVNALIKKNLSPGVDPLRPGIVHRLDKEVSGLMILSKTKKAQDILIEQFKSKQVKRTYKALVFGLLKEEKAEINNFIGRHAKDRKKFCCFNNEGIGRKKAITYYKVLESFAAGKIHHIECHLHTGRTHQIRVHLSHKKLPILGDSVYFPKKKKHLSHLKKPTLKNLLLSLEKPALFSARLEFSHPINQKKLSFTLSWPKEFHFFMEKLHFSFS